MSLILDALNRSRQDVGDIPGLESQHLPAEESPGLGSRLWPLALVIALGVIAYLLYERSDENTPEPAKVAQVEAQAVEKRAEKLVEKVEEQKTVPLPVQPRVIEPERAAKLEPPAPPSLKPRQPVAPDSAVAALYGGEGDVVEASAQVAANTPVPPESDKATVAPVPAKPIVREKKISTEEPVDIAQIVQRAQEELADASLDEHSAPFLASLSQQIKNDIPTIFYERHDYSGKPGQSSVVLNGKKVKPGGKTRGGVRVDEILAGSVVLSYRGTQFRLRALNSWVNL